MNQALSRSQSPKTGGLRRFIEGASVSSAYYVVRWILWHSRLALVGPIFSIKFINLLIDCGHVYSS